MGATDTLNQAREAVFDAQSCRKQLKMLTSSTDDRVASMMRRNLESRLRRDEQTISTAAELILSSDVLTDRQRDVLMHRYVWAKTWTQVAQAVGSSPRPCQYDRKAALAALDV